LFLRVDIGVKVKGVCIYCVYYTLRWPESVVFKLQLACLTYNAFLSVLNAYARVAYDNRQFNRLPPTFLKINADCLPTKTEMVNTACLKKTGLGNSAIGA